jgi:hypothetical protein
MVGGNWVVVVGKGEDRCNVEMLADSNRWLLEDEVASVRNKQLTLSGGQRPHI